MPRLSSGPIAPSDVEVLKTDVTYAEVASDETLADDLRRLGLEPTETHYRLLQLPARELASAMCALADYLTDDDEAGYHQAEQMSDVLAGGGTLAPVVIAYGDDYVTLAGYGQTLGRWVVLDGFHRLCAHGEAGSETIDAYQLLVDG